MFPFGSTKESAAKKRKRNNFRTYFGPLDNAVVDCCVKDDVGADVNAADGATSFLDITPQKSIDLSMYDVMTTTDDMLSRVTHRAFVNSGVVK